MVSRIHQYIRTTSTWAVTGIVIVMAVVLANGMNFIFSRLINARLTWPIIIFGTIDAIVIPALIAPLVLTLFKRAANLRDINGLLEREADDRRQAEQATERRAANLVMISEMAVECAAASPDTDLPRLIAEKLYTITGALAVGLSTYDAYDQVLTTRHLAVSGQILSAANKILGRNFIGLTSSVSPVMLHHMLTDGFTIADDLTQATFGAIPRPVAAALQKTFGLGSLVGLSLCYGGELWGTAVIALHTGQPPLERDLGLALANIAAVALRRHKVEKALRREKQFSDDILQGLPGVFFMYDAQGQLVRWNEQHERVLGYSAQELTGMHATDFFEEPDKELVARQIRRAFVEGEANAEATVITRAGQRIPYYFVGLRTMLDNKPYLLGFGIDITDRRHAAAERERLITELAAKNTELEQFTYTVSHDLRSPLITLRGFLGFMDRDLADGNVERVRADMARISEATNKMQDFLEELLELSRIGRMINPPQAVPFEAIAHEAIELVRGRIAARRVQVETAHDLPVVYGDRMRLVQVVQNLVDNAVKFMGDQAQPYVEIGQRDASNTDGDDGPVLFVRDNGMGIELEHQDRVFGLFDRLNAQTEGSGIGLALVKRIIEVHGGRIWVESEGRGKGATFCFRLPTPPA
jgi:PAS domain S-box-containing protein